MGAASDFEYNGVIFSFNPYDLVDDICESLWLFVYPDDGVRELGMGRWYVDPDRIDEAAQYIRDFASAAVAQGIKAKVKDPRDNANVFAISNFVDKMVYRAGGIGGILKAGGFNPQQRVDLD